MQPLTDADLETLRADLHADWAVEGDALVRTLELGGFRAAMAFLVRLGFEAEALQHHPEIHNVYGTVRLRLTTHDAGDRITRRDVDLARRIDALV